MAEARRELDDPQLTSMVELTGWIDSDAKVDKLRSAHLLVLPSYMEGMPNALIEAMAAGLPVVATDVGAVTDVVSDGVNGLVVPPRNTGRLAEALRDLLVDARLRERMGQMCIRDRISGRWHWLGEQSDMRSLMQRHDALIHPSLYELSLIHIFLQSR